MVSVAVGKDILESGTTDSKPWVSVTDWVSIHTNQRSPKSSPSGAHSSCEPGVVPD